MDAVPKKSSLTVASRIAGLAYVLIIVDALASLIFVDGKILVPGDMAATVTNIRDNELLFRAGVFGNVLMFLMVAVLAVSLFVLLEAVDRSLATLALLLRFGEAIIGTVGMMLGGLVPLLLVTAPTALEPGHLQSLVSVFLELENRSIDVVLIFMGVGGIIFCYLFLKSRSVPKALSLWGIVTYATMLSVGATRIFYPALPEPVFMALAGPGILFEVVFGFWLLLKGVRRPAGLTGGG